MTCDNNILCLLGWLGYSDEYCRRLCKTYLKQGFTAFKLKVGQNLANDRDRCQLVREEIGWENKLVRVNDFLAPFGAIPIRIYNQLIQI